MIEKSLPAVIRRPPSRFGGLFIWDDVERLAKGCHRLAFPTRRVAEKLAGGEARHERNHRNMPRQSYTPQRGGRISCATSGAHSRLWVWSGGYARASLHHRLISLIPPGWADSRVRSATLREVAKCVEIGLGACVWSAVTCHRFGLARSAAGACWQRVERNEIVAGNPASAAPPQAKAATSRAHSTRRRRAKSLRISTPLTVWPMAS